MANYMSYYPYDGYGSGSPQYAYDLRDQTVQRVPSGVFFPSDQISAGREKLETLEKGIDPHFFPRFLNLDCRFVSSSSNGASVSSTGSEMRCLPLLDVNIDVDVQSSIAKTKVMQTFTNLSNYTIKETNYSFPLYDGSAVVSFRCYVGEDKLLEGVIKPKEVAEREFKEAVAKQKVAALLEEHTPEVFETKLGNIPARTSVKVELIYVNELKADIGGEGVLVTLPNSIAPRYGAPPPQMSTSSATDKNGLHITVNVHASVSLRKLESRTHPISVEMGTAGTAGSPAAVSSFGDLASAAEGSHSEYDPKKAKAILSERHVALGRDFVLMILAAGSSMLASGARLEEPPGAEAQSAMKLTLNPRDLFSSHLEPDSFNGEIIFIADRSGSMYGPKMNTLKDALNLSLKSLAEKVHFNIYSFGSTFHSLWPQSQLYTDGNVELAVQTVSTFTADMGGTEILRPFQEAVRTRRIKDNFTTQIICLTDGEVWDEPAVRQFVRDARSESKGTVRFFALGIGNAVSHRLIEGIGTEGGGFAEVVAVDSRERWEGRVIRMLKGAFTPESYDCELEFNGMSTTAACLSAKGSGFMQAPFKIPALHPFSRITIYFLFDKEYSTDLNSVSVKASTPSGERISAEVLVSKTTTSTYIVHHLAAKAIVMDLETGKSWLHSALANSKAADIAAKELGERLAINYHITSKWTSFVAVEKKSNEQHAGQLYRAPRGDLAIMNKSRTAPIAQEIRTASALSRWGQSEASSYSTWFDPSQPAMEDRRACFTPFFDRSCSVRQDPVFPRARSRDVQDTDLFPRSYTDRAPPPETPMTLWDDSPSLHYGLSPTLSTDGELKSHSKEAIVSTGAIRAEPVSTSDCKKRKEEWRHFTRQGYKMKGSKMKLVGGYKSLQHTVAAETGVSKGQLHASGSDAAHTPSEKEATAVEGTSSESPDSMQGVTTTREASPCQSSVTENYSSSSSVGEFVTFGSSHMLPRYLGSPLPDIYGEQQALMFGGSYSGSSSTTTLAPAPKGQPHAPGSDAAHTPSEKEAIAVEGTSSESPDSMQSVTTTREARPWESGVTENYSSSSSVDDSGSLDMPPSPDIYSERRALMFDGLDFNFSSTTAWAPPAPKRQLHASSSDAAHTPSEKEAIAVEGISSESPDSMQGVATIQEGSAARWPIDSPGAPVLFSTQASSVDSPCADADFYDANFHFVQQGYAPPVPKAAVPAAAPGPTSRWSKDVGGDNGSVALNLQNLILVQSVKGSFELPPYLLKALCSYFNAGIMSTLDDTLSSNGEDMKTKLGDTIELLLQTVLAVMWIKLGCAKDKELWDLLVRKAERWIGKTVEDKRVEERLCECAKAQWVGSAGRS